MAAVVAGPFEGVDGIGQDDPTGQAEARIRLVDDATERGQATERKVDLGHAARRTVIADPPAEVRPELDRIDEIEERPFRIERRDHGARVELLASEAPVFLLLVAHMPFSPFASWTA